MGLREALGPKQGAWLRRWPTVRSGEWSQQNTRAIILVNNKASWRVRQHSQDMATGISSHGIESNRRLRDWQPWRRLMFTMLEGLSPRQISRLRTRFWAHVHEDGRDHNLPADQCWEWRGAYYESGWPTYGYRRLGVAVQGAAAKLAYALEVGDFDASLGVRPTCGNKRCVNPAHLALVAIRPENDVPQAQKFQAAMAVNYAVWKRGTLPRASTLECDACGQPAAHYHHYLGYDPEHWLDVQPLCVKCHKQAELVEVQPETLI